MHLLDEFLVRERAQIQIFRFFFSHNGKTLGEFTLANQSPILWLSLPYSVSAATQHRRIATLEIYNRIALEPARRPDKGREFNEDDGPCEFQATECPDSGNQDIRTNSPDRGLGSKQVDFGGMTSLASATAISSPMDVG